MSTGQKSFADIAKKLSPDDVFKPLSGKRSLTFKDFPANPPSSLNLSEKEYKKAKGILVNIKKYVKVKPGYETGNTPETKEYLKKVILREIEALINNGEITPNVSDPIDSDEEDINEY